MLHELNGRKLDWITVTATGGELADWVEFIDNSGGGRVTRTRLGRIRDFHGAYYAHPTAGRFFLGNRWEERLGGKRVYLQASGANAALTGKSLSAWAWAERRYKSLKCTRMDIACDVPVPDFLSLDLVTDRISTTHIRNNGGGETLYIGDRSDDEFVRIYRKTLEFSGEGINSGAWEVRVLRFETEYKGAMAQALWHSYCETGLLDGADFGMLREFAPEVAAYLPDFDTCEIEVVKGKRKEKPDTMAWLRGVVSGTILKMLRDHDKQVEMLDLLIFWVEQAKRCAGR